MFVNKYPPYYSKIIMFKKSALVFPFQSMLGKLNQLKRIIIGNNE